MLVIRFKRIGKKNRPTYRVVVAEHSMPVSGKFVKDLGFYNPHTKAVGIDKDQALDWLKKGAQPSNSVAKLFVKEKIKHDSVVVIKQNKKPKSQAETKAAVLVAAAPVSDQATETVAEQPAVEVASEPESTTESEEAPAAEKSAETAPVA